MYAVSGVLAAAAGMAVGHLVAAFVNPAASPVLAVGSTVIDATPTPVKEWAVQNFGTADKPILLGSVDPRDRPRCRGDRPGVAHQARAWPTSSSSAWPRWPASPRGSARRPRRSTSSRRFVTAIVGVVTITGLRALIPNLPTPGAASAPAPRGRRAGHADRTATRRSRRWTTRHTPRGSAARPLAATSSSAQPGSPSARPRSARSGQKLAAPATLPSSVALPKPQNTLAALPPASRARSRASAPFSTPLKEFYRVDTALVIPRIDVDNWVLEIDGKVDNKLSITFAELLKMPMIEKDITLNCVSNEVGGPYISSTRWLGVRVRDLLERAGIQDGVDQILSESTDGMTISTPIEALTDDRDALIAVAMNGEPLPDRHGFPARMVTPGLYGFVGATKWLTKLTATTYAADKAYWTKRDWAIDGTVKTQARIDTPAGLATYKPGKVAIGGVAWAQRRGIKEVEVRVDDGPWQKATLGPDGGTDYWRQWFWVWDATTGRHDLTVRATDGTGEVQTKDRADPFPGGASGWHSIVVLIS